MKYEVFWASLGVGAGGTARPEMRQGRSRNPVKSKKSEKFKSKRNSSPSNVDWLRFSL